jgi:hypothetical protein
MNLHRNVLAIVAGAALMASLPVGAQVLGGSLDGAANGTFGGTIGGAGVNGAGAASAAGRADIDASDTFGAARARARHAAGEGRDVAIGAAGTARSRVDSTRGTVGAAVDTTHSVGARANRRAVQAASETRSSTSIGQTSAVQADSGSNGGLFVNGAGEARTEQRAMGRNIAAEGVAGSQTSADRSGLTSSGYGEAGLSIAKPQPAAPAPEPTPAPADSDPSVQQ